VLAAERAVLPVANPDRHWLHELLTYPAANVSSLQTALRETVHLARCREDAAAAPSAADVE
jgi:hypothetical protein